VSHKPYNHLNNSKKEQIVAMFDGIASTYDLLNRLITFRMDIRWRKQVSKIVHKKNPKNILDVATGTGDLAIELSHSHAKIIGIDISQNMLDIGQEKLKKLHLEHKINMKLGDAEALSFNDRNFDAITVGFGVRNFQNLNQGLKEIQRVLKPGGQLVILETSVPQNFLLRKGYQLYTRAIIPIFGALFTKDKMAYEYLSSSAISFPHGKCFNDILETNGFKNISNYPKMCGIVTIYTAFK
jgi:demethylmenaquinone methyltransferase/2-methoxy-6-polyprenyl-1,4-benzoquinol methylase|tara:strand:- start:2676 stop:3395 length:720 start_codon:yes stop_codon:yes gene_type:complete